MKIAVLGAGAMGAALSFPLAAQGHAVSLYGTEFDSETLEALREGKPHPRINRRLPDSVRLFDPEQLDEATSDAQALILAVNTEGLLPQMNALLPYLDSSVPLISIAKGFVDLEGEALPVASAIRSYLELKALPHPPPVACLVGPSIAEEVARGVPTLVQLAGDDSDKLRMLADALSGHGFHCRFCSDLRGLETCAAYKNIYTIALSWPAGLSEDNGANGQVNLKAILFLQVLDEIRWLALAGDGEAETALGIAGLGDLVATAEAGRNGAFGKRLGRGESAESALERMAEQGIHTIEGRESAKLGVEYARQLQHPIRKHLPLLHAIHDVLYAGKSVRAAIDDLDLAELASMNGAK